MLIASVLLLICVIALSGCATPQADPTPPPVPKVVGDSYCSATSRQSYSIKDTPPTIDDIRGRNAGYEARCKEKK